MFVSLHACSKDDPSWKPPSLSTPLLAEDLDRPSYSTLPAPKALNIHAKNKKVKGNCDGTISFIFILLIDVIGTIDIFSVQGGQSSVVVFNPLAERVTEVISVFVETSDVCVVEASTGKEIFYQVRTVQIF